MIPNCFLAQCILNWHRATTSGQNIFLIYTSPFYQNKQKYAKYEIMILFGHIGEVLPIFR